MNIPNPKRAATIKALKDALEPHVEVELADNAMDVVASCVYQYIHFLNCAKTASNFPGKLDAAQCLDGYFAACDFLRFKARAMGLPVVTDEIDMEALVREADDQTVKH